MSLGHMGPFGAFKEHGTRLKAIDPVAELARCLLTGAMGREAGSWQVAEIAGHVPKKRALAPEERGGLR